MLSALVFAASATADRTIFLSEIAYVPNVGGSSGVDAICDADAIATLGMGASGFGFIGTSTDDRCFLFPGSEVVNNVLGDLVATDAADYFDGTIANGFSYRLSDQADQGGSSTWSGAGGVNTCNDWTDGTNAFQGQICIPSATTNNFYNSINVLDCSASRRFVCLTGSPPVLRDNCEDPDPAQGNQDPHFVGFDGSRFDFTGVAGETFNLISEAFLNVNMRVTELSVAGQNGTWIQALGFRFGEEYSLVVDAEKHVVINNNKVVADAGVYAVSDLVQVEVSPNVHKVSVRSPTYSFTVLVRPEGYLNIRSSINQMPENPHGVLGQTARHLAEGRNAAPVKSLLPNGEDLLEGSMIDYQTTDLLSADFRFSRYENVEDAAAGSTGKRVDGVQFPVRSIAF